MKYVVIYEKCENNYSAYVPDLPGCIAVGETLEEARESIAEAIEFHIEALLETGEPVPPSSLTRQFKTNLSTLKTTEMSNKSKP